MPRADRPAPVTLGDFFRLAVRRFRAARLAYGHGTTNAVDEAAFLVLEALRLPIHTLDPWLDLKPTPAERARLATLIEARIALRMPAPYLLGAAYMHGVRFHVDRRALIPRSFIGDMLVQGSLPIGDPSKVRRVLDLCTGSGCLAILAALDLSPCEDRRGRPVGRRPRARPAQRRDPPAGRSHRAPSRRSLQAARRPALRSDPRQPALCRCERHGETAAGVPTRAQARAGGGRRRARSRPAHPGRRAPAPDKERRPSVRTGPRPPRLWNAPFRDCLFSGWIPN